MLLSLIIRHALFQKKNGKTADRLSFPGIVYGPKFAFFQYKHVGRNCQMLAAPEEYFAGFFILAIG
jgi:hypothetical protein